MIKKKELSQRIECVEISERRQDGINKTVNREIVAIKDRHDAFVKKVNERLDELEKDNKKLHTTISEILDLLIKDQLDSAFEHLGKALDGLIAEQEKKGKKSTQKKKCNDQPKQEKRGRGRPRKESK